MPSGPGPAQSNVKYVIMLGFFVAGALAIGLAGHWGYAPVVGWDAAAAAFSLRMLPVLMRADAATTRTHATVDDPSPTTTELLVLAANLASLGSVVFVVVRANSDTGAARALLAALAVGSTALAWLLIHVLFTLRYARLYYSGPDGGISFNQNEPPRYSDFAYLAFTIGMTYQVSDTNLEQHMIRATALRHGLLSYLFGSVILATVINLVVGLSNG